MRIKVTGVILLVLSLLVACNSDIANEGLGDHETKDIKELVHGYSIGSIDAQSASITSTQLIVTDNDHRESVYNLPEDEFFVSIAPFINETHP